VQHIRKTVIGAAVTGQKLTDVAEHRLGIGIRQGDPVADVSKPDTLAGLGLGDNRTAWIEPDAKQKNEEPSLRRCPAFPGSKAAGDGWPVQR
jgi:hypothetical protein